MRRTASSSAYRISTATLRSHAISDVTGARPIVVTCTGHGLETGDAVLISDNERPGPVAVPVATLQRALGGPAPVPMDGISVLSLGEVDPVPPRRAREGVLQQAVRLTEEAAPRTGVPGLRALAA